VPKKFIIAELFEFFGIFAEKFDLCRIIQLMQKKTGLRTVNKSEIHTRARTRLLTEWQER
jgi:hypothetical protein